MNAAKLIEALAATPSRIEKEQLVFNAFMTGERQFFAAAKLVFDPLVSFGVQKVALVTEDDGDPGGTLTYEDFLKLLQALRKRELTGHAARDAINAAALACDTFTWNTFYRRIILRDLKCGVESSTINKVLKKIAPSEPEAADYIIPVFSPQLATDGADDNGRFLNKHRRDKKLLDIKFDGVRLTTVLDKESGTVTQYTREGRVNDNFPHIVEALTKLLPHIPGSIVLDGEITAGSFQELMEQLNTKEKAEATTKLALFDIVPLSDFRKGECLIGQKDRHEMLVAIGTSGLFQECAGAVAYVLPKIEIDFDTEEGRAEFEAFLIKTAKMAETDAIVEGVMVKDPDAPYHSNGSDSWVRTEAWLKIKPVIEVSLTVTGLEQGKPGKKHANTLGGLICEGEDLGRKIKVVCGGGLSDAQRHEWWTSPEKITGFIVEIWGDKLTKPKKGDVWSLRFPRLKGLRGTQPGEKL